MSISVFGFQALWSPYYFAALVLVTIVYFLLTTIWRHKFKVSEPLKKNEAVNFVLAMITLYILKGSPIDLMGHITFTMHMTQMAFLLLLTPILLIKGIPWWIWNVVINIPAIRTVFNILTKPLIAIFLFVGLFSFYHLPSVFDMVKLNMTYHSIYTVILFVSAVLMYWPLLTDVEGQSEMKNMNKLAYIASNAVLITPACALIIFASTPLYATFSESESWMQAMALCVPMETLTSLNLSGPEIFTNMDSVSDQQIGGVLMKIIQEIIFGVILFRVFRKWWNSERTNQEDITEQALRDFQNRTNY